MSFQHGFLTFLLLLVPFAMADHSRKLMMKIKSSKRPFNNTIPALLVFGDSTVDTGNNNYWMTPFKSNFPPYGKNFANGVPTGRFSDGKLVTDFLASYLGIKEYVPPYLDDRLPMGELMTGVCFASAGSGYDLVTAELSGVIPVPTQLEFFKEYKLKLEAAMGKERTKSMIKKAIFLVSAGTNDFVINYFGVPLRRETYSISAYQDFLLQHVQELIKGLREEGAGLITLVGLPPIGCLPIVITFDSTDAFASRHCNDSLSSFAIDYNKKLKKLLATMQNPSSPLEYIDIYNPLHEMVEKPSQFGFDVVNVGCCGSGLVEASFLCTPLSPICSTPSKYLFFDSVHPTESAYKNLFGSLRPQIDRVIENHYN